MPRMRSMTPLSRYQTHQGEDGEFQPGSRGRVMRNLPGITSVIAMDRAEHAALIPAQEKWLGKLTARTHLTAALICKMHRDWLGNIYPWAGRYRTVEVAKGGFRWPPANLVQANMQMLTDGVLHECTPCKPNALESVAQNIARVHADFLLVHPFRDGNGRMARWLADLMAMQAGYDPVNYRFDGRGGPARRARYLNAVKLGYLADYRPLADFFAAALAGEVRLGLSNPRAPSKMED